jgi:D-beta-D-heptose 7-phosphate kinase/D-beta-D-heptose 1-phosphate adenosyltransferase
LDVFQAARWANIAAGVVCGKSGVATTALSELKNYAERFEPWQRKVKTLEELQQKVQEERLRGHRVIFTNGCFDLIHVGHIQLLQAARALGDLLIVGINSDESVHEIKGEGRPLIPGKERLQILASLDCVDYLSVYSGSTPNEMIQALRPDVLVKGGNYSPEEVTGHEIVENYGGRVELIRIKREVSVSGLVDHIVQRFGKEIS